MGYDAGSVIASRQMCLGLRVPENRVGLTLRVSVDTLHVPLPGRDSGAARGLAVGVQNLNNAAN